MNIRELLLIVFFAIVTTWTIEYLFFSKKSVETSDQIQSGQGYVAPKKAQELKPIDTEVDFSESKRTGALVKTPIETAQMKLLFSTDAGSLERLEFKKELNGVPKTIDTIFPLKDTEKDKHCFLVALEEQTPYYYTLIDYQDLANEAIITYQAQAERCTIQKKFSVSKQGYSINLALTIIPKSGPVQARLFYPAPLMPEIADDVKSGFIGGSNNDKITIIQRSKIDENMYWSVPTLFGTENRYFMHTMLAPKESNQFAQRAYYKLSGKNELFAILEGPKIEQETTWNIPFYFGPKEEQVLKSVDPRLESTLDYAGWLAPVSKLLLRILLFLHSYLMNYGLAIIALTILIKIILLPLTIKSAQSMKQTTEMQRKLQYIQQKYKEDPETLARERAELIRKHGMPGMAGCLPILLQIPIFIALSRVLSSSIELYQAPFTFWIHDLSKPDPWYILPIAIGLSMLLQSTTVEAKQRLQFVLMAIVFGVISMSFSAGLCLYIFMSTFLGVVQTYIQNKFKLA